MEGDTMDHDLAVRVGLLESRLQQKEDDVRMAAEIGNQLLATNDQLTSQMEEANASAASKIEELEQEKFSLVRALDTKEHMEQTYLDDIELLKSALNKQKENLRLKIEMQHDIEVQPLKCQIATQQSELEQSHLVTTQLRETVTQLETMLSDTQEQLQLRSRSLNETSSVEIAELNEEITDLHAAKMALTLELSNCKNGAAQLALQVETLSEQQSKKQEEIEEIQCHATANYNALLESREDYQELKVELDAIKLESQHFKKKGNSLFGEVEDRRVKVERELVSLKVQHSSLKKQNELLRQQLHKLKTEVAGLLQMAGRRGNERMTERLLQQLSQAQSEVKSLQRKVLELEERESALDRQPRECPGGGGTHVADDGSMGCMKGLLSRTESEKANLKQELRTKTLIALAESDKVITCEKQIYRLDHEVKSLKSQDFRLRLQLEEMRMKYEPNSLKTDAPQPKRNIEQIDLEPERATEEANNTKDTTSEHGGHQPTLSDDITKPQPDIRHEKRKSRSLATKRSSDINIMPPGGDGDAEAPSKKKQQRTIASDVEVATRNGLDSVGEHEGSSREQKNGASSARGVVGVRAVSKTVELKEDCKVQ